MELWLTGLTTVGVVVMLTPGLFVWDQFVTVPKGAAEVEVVGSNPIARSIFPCLCKSPPSAPAASAIAHSAPSGLRKAQ